jgi:hypothetical protein
MHFRAFQPFTNFFVITFIIVATSCSNDDNPGPNTGEGQVLVSSELVYSNTAQQLKFLVQLSGIEVDPNEFLYDIDIYKVVYNTDYDGATIQPKRVFI